MNSTNSTPKDLIELLEAYYDYLNDVRNPIGPFPFDRSNALGLIYHFLQWIKYKKEQS